MEPSPRTGEGYKTMHFPSMPLYPPPRPHRQIAIKKYLSLEEEKMKVCFIGMCGHSKQAWRTLKSRPDVQLCGVAAGSHHENMVASFDPAIPFFTDARQMLDTVRPELVILSPVFGLTGGWIVECAARGIDVFSEKPVASSLDELAVVRAAVKASGIRFGAMHFLRYAPAFYEAGKLAREGAIGGVRLIHAQKSYKYGTRPDWYADRSLYGGTIPWVGIHAVDWISYFTGKRFLSVDAAAWGKPEMAALCQFQMEDGILASASLDYYRPATARTHGDDRVRCVGTDGVIEVRDGEILLIGGDGEKRWKPESAPDLVELFLAGNGMAPEEIFRITEAALCARDAADVGKTVIIGG